jgi:simple sugar transport system ATP-binding protein
MAAMMIGTGTARSPMPRTGAAGAAVLSVKGVKARDRSGLKEISIETLEVKAGEIVGIAGVSGNGQQELLAALSGEDPRAEAGAVRLFGEPIGQLRSAARRKLGLHFIPEERLGRGAVPTLSLAANMLLTRRESLRRFGWIDRTALRVQTSGVIERFNVKSGGPGAVARSLSGGNLQKYIVGREIDAVPRVLIVAQPTWGVDVGAAAQIRAELLALRDAGCAVLVVSEELDELFAMTDRLHVIAKGRLSPAIATEAATVELVGEWMSGLWGAEGPPADAPPARPPGPQVQAPAPGQGGTPGGEAP